MDLTAGGLLGVAAEQTLGVIASRLRQEGIRPAVEFALLERK